jgi:hypothetical protein
MLARRIFSIASSRRTMASTAKPKLEWLVMIPDKPNALEQRMKVRP